MSTRKQSNPLLTGLRAVAFALLGAFLVGFLIGLWLERELARPAVYIGAAPAPFDIGNAGAAVLETGQDEQKIRKPV